MPVARSWISYTLLPLGGNECVYGVLWRICVLSSVYCKLWDKLQCDPDQDKAETEDKCPIFLFIYFTFGFPLFIIAIATEMSISLDLLLLNVLKLERRNPLFFIAWRHKQLVWWFSDCVEPTCWRTVNIVERIHFFPSWWAHLSYFCLSWMRFNWDNWTFLHVLKPRTHFPFSV